MLRKLPATKIHSFINSLSGHQNKYRSVAAIFPFRLPMKYMQTTDDAALVVTNADKLAICPVLCSAI
jgi:hypothetical protein